MNDHQELIDSYLDGELTAEQETRLADWLAADRENMRLFVREAHLHRQLRDIMLAQSYQVKASPVVAKMEQPDLLSLITAAVLTFRRIWLPLAACLIMAMGFGIWYLNPAAGQPALAELQGSGLILERSGQRILATRGVRLQPGDVLRTPKDVTAVIGYAPEPTRIKILPGTELTLTAWLRGKVFALGEGKLEATVARQSPFGPMIISTPQARARVVGTRFTLLVASNATRLDVMEGKVRFTGLNDEKFAQVSAGHYAVAAADYELAALPFTGNLLREWWTNVSGDRINAFRDNPRFPNHPDGWDFAKELELRPVKTNHVGMRFCGYLHPPVTGNYEFWLAGATDAELFMSPDDNPAAKVVIANGPGFSKSNWDQPRFRGGSQWAPPVPLVAGRTYYIEAIVFIYAGEGDLSVAWKRPGASRELLTGEYLSPFKPN
jgi:FecR protein